MRRECTEALLNALLVSNIGIYIMKYGKLGTVQCRNVKPRLPHQSKKSNGLKRNRLATGIRSGDNEEIKCIPQCKRDRNDIFLI